MTSSLMDVHPVHQAELDASCIAPDRITARGYRTLSGSEEDQHVLKDLRIPRWAWRDETAFPGLLIPMYRVTGEEIGCQWKPSVPQEAPGGKKEKYTSQSGVPNRLDVPPLSADLVRDPSAPLWITEGVKKGDCLSSRGKAVITLTGVFNWRSKLGTLGDWEDIPLKGRTVVVCFDADARDKRSVMLAMRRLGKWLESKGASDVRYLIVPPEVNGTAVKGVDDYFCAGGTLEDLGSHALKELPTDGAKDASFSDAVLTDTLCSEELDGRFKWSAGLGWMEWSGKVWNAATDASVTEAVRLWALNQFNLVIDRQKGDPNRDMDALISGWRSVLSASRMRALVGLARGILECHATDFDADPDLLNCPNGILDLRTGHLEPHDPDRFMTKIAGVDYVKGAQHPDWDTALEALPGELHEWFQMRIGQSITGHMTPDDVVVISQGGGENGKSTVFDAITAAAGQYYTVVADRAMLGNGSDNHPTEMMDFLGARLAVLEETPEERRLDTNRLKKLSGTAQISARKIRQDSVTFAATHTLFVNSNHRPDVHETDHGTWRRLLLLVWPFTFQKDPKLVKGPYDRLGDPTLRQRVKENVQVREAVLAWMVAGARLWYEADRILPQHPDRVAADTLKWRKVSDMILSYIGDMITFDPDSHILSTELFTSFNDYVKEKGGQPWGDKTFVGRFGGHQECSQHRVEKRKIKARNGLSRLNGFGSVPASYASWLGIRFKDLDKEDQVDGGDQDQVPPVPAESITQLSPTYGRVNNSAGTAGTGSWTPKVDGGTMEFPTPESSTQSDPVDKPSMIETDPFADTSTTTDSDIFDWEA